MRLLSVLLLLVPFALFADARFVEAPAECHFPYDNANVDNEFKLSSCAGVLKSHSGGARYNAHVFVERNGLAPSPFIIDGQDVRDTEEFPNGTLTTTTRGEDSGTVCNIVDAGGNEYETPNWQAIIRIHRNQSTYNVNTSYTLNCWGAQQVAQ